MKGYHNSKSRQYDNGFQSDYGFDDFGRDLLNWNMNHGYGRALFGEWDWDDYGSMKRWADMPFLGRIFDNRAERLKEAELRRYNEDRARNLGIDLKDNPYPIMSGLYGMGATVSFGGQSSNVLADFYSDMEHLKHWVVPKKR